MTTDLPSMRGGRRNSW